MVISKIIEVPQMDVTALLAGIPVMSLSPKVQSSLLSAVFEFARIFSVRQVQAAIDQILGLETLPEITMYLLLKVDDFYPQMNEYFLNNALPSLISKRVWESSTLFRGFIRIIEKKLPKSLKVIDMLPVECQEILKQKDSVKKAMMEASIRRGAFNA